MVRGLGILFVVMTVALSALPAAAAEETRVRKSVTALSTEEKARFVAAVKELKRDETYEKYVSWHVELTRCDPTDPFSEDQMRGHNGPVFLPWHRQMLLELEDDLQAIDPTVTIPYWDWTDNRQESLDKIFGEDFMGPEGDPNDGYVLKKGPFRASEWKLEVDNTGLLWGHMNGDAITRNINEDRSLLPTPAAVEAALNLPEFDVAPFDDSSDNAKSFRNSLEGWVAMAPHTMSLCGPDGWIVIPGEPFDLRLHNAVHDWVGGTTSTPTNPSSMVGTMLTVPSSPNDPTFFIHHAQVDRLWALWQQRHPDKHYVPEGSGVNGADAPMAPFDDVTPRDVESIAELGYEYAAAPAVPERAASMRAARKRRSARGRTRSRRVGYCQFGPYRFRG